MRFPLFCAVFLVFFLQQASALHAQYKIDLDVRQATLVDLLQQIREQSGLDYSVRGEQAHLFNPVSIQVEDMDLKEVLARCFAGQQLDYTIKNNTIIILDRPINQQRFISGIVVDTAQQPLGGATLQIKETKQTTRTNGKGEFRFDNIPQTVTLIISYVGYERREFNIGDNVGNLGPIFMLKKEVASIDEVTVVANTGYQKIDLNTATGSMVVLDEKDIQESPALSLMERLEGRIPGVKFDVKTNQLLIRTPNTFLEKGSAPLIVIDGFPALQQELVKNPTGTGDRFSATSTSAGILNNFNPDDIASITVLKDAAAASIWGSRAANGVIVIETKAGKRSGNSVHFSSTFSTSAPANLNNLRTMNAAEYIEFEKELFDNNFLYDPTTDWRYANVSDAQNVMFQAKRNEITEAERDAILAEMGQRNNRNQLQDYLLQSAQTQQYNLSFNGAVANGSYYASAVYSSDRPIYRGNKADNYSATFNFTNRYFDDRLIVNLGLNQNLQKSKVNGGVLKAISPGPLGLTPYDMLLDENGNSIDRYYILKPDVIQDFESQGYLPWAYNHIEQLQYANDHYENNLSRINAQLSFQALPWLNAALSGSYQKGMRNLESLREKESYEMVTLLNEGTRIDDNGKLTYGVPMGGKLYTSNSKNDDYSVRFQLNANKNWNTIHDISVIAGSEIRQNFSTGYTQTRYGFDVDSYQSVLIDPTVPYTDMYGYSKRFNIQDAPVNISRIRYLSYYANAAYALFNKYYVTGSVRFDDATILGIDRAKRAIPLWSTGVRWDMKKEHWLQEVAWLSGLSLRGSLGTGGSVPGSGSAYTLYNASVIDSYTNLPTGYITTPANQMLGWETTRTLNGGIDLSFFANRLSAQFDIYGKRSYGIMAGVPYNATYGWTSINFNTANMKSNGFELSLMGDIIRNQDWNWNSQFNIAYNKTEVTDDRYPNNKVQIGRANQPVIGFPIDRIFAYYWAGLDDKGRSQIKDGEGNILTVDDSESSFTPDDLHYMGRASAPYYGGWTNRLSYKGLSLTAHVSMYLGHKVIRQDINSSQYPSNANGFTGFLSTSKRLVDRWRKPGDEAFTDVPGVLNTNFSNISRFQNADINVIDGSHIRLQQLSLDYSLPASFLAKVRGIQSAAIGATANNIGLIWKKASGDIDPEYMFNGTYQSMPPVTSYNFRLRVNF